MGNFIWHVSLRDRGFTLAELLIVVSVISVLTLMGLTSFNRQAQRARDDQRMSDLEQIRSALEMYRLSRPDRTYPVYTSGTADARTTLTTPLLQFITAVPQDPGQNNAQRQYYYQSIENNTEYRLCARFEMMAGTSTDCPASSCGADTCNYQVTSP